MFGKYKFSRLLDVAHIASSRLMDICMLEIQNSRERELDDWVDLLRRADSRFKFLRATQPQGSKLHLLEVEWSGENVQ